MHPVPKWSPAGLVLALAASAGLNTGLAAPIPSAQTPTIQRGAPPFVPPAPQPSPSTRSERQAPAQDGIKVPLHLFEQKNRLLEYELVELLDLPDIPQPRFQVPMSLDGRPVTLDLRLHSVRTSDFEVLGQGESGEVTVYPSGWVRTFVGSILEDKQAQVAGSLLTTGMEAVITFPDGRVFGIQPHFESFLTGDRTQFVVYNQSDTTDQPSECEASELTAVDAVPHGGIAQLGFNPCTGNFCVAELALDLDFPFYTFYGSSVGNSQEFAEAIVNVVNVQFQRDVSIEYRVGTIFIRQSGLAEPVAYVVAQTISDMLFGFRGDWNQNHSDIPRDLTHLFTHRFTGNNSFASIVCDSLTTGSNYAVTGTQSGGLACIADNAAHAMGHNWGADHCACGTPGSEYTMNASPPCVLRFNPVLTSPQIATYRDTRTCLSAGLINDDLAHALPIATGIFSGTTNGATLDGSQACYTSNPDGPDVWYTFTPEFSGLTTVDTCGAGTDFDTILSVHNMGLGSTSDEIACNDQFCGNSSSLTFDASSGSTYWIRVAGWNSNSGDFDLTLSGPSAAVPENDNWEDATHIGPGDYYGTTHGATPDGDTLCSGLGRDVWYRYTPRSNGQLTVDLCDSNYDASIAIHDATHPFPWSTLAILTCDSDGCGLKALTSYGVTAGHPYLIRIAGYFDEAGSYALSLSGPSVANEVCAGAIPIEGGVMTGDLQGAFERDGLVPCVLSSNDVPGLWYRYTAPANGLLFATTCGTHDTPAEDLGMDTVLTLYSGCPGDGSTVLQCNDDSVAACPDLELGSIRNSYIEHQVTQGTDYWLRVGRFSWNTDAGRFRLTVDLRPPNDDCSNALVVQDGQYQGSTRVATQGGSTTCGITSTSPDVWYDYTVLCDGILTISTCGTHDAPGLDMGMDTVLSLHSGCPGTTGNTLHCNDDSISCVGLDQGIGRDSSLTIPVQAGQNYKIRVTSFATTDPGDFTLNIDCVVANDDCVAGIPIGTGTVFGNNAGASVDGSNTCGGTGPDVWYFYTAPCTGIVTVSTCGTHDTGGIDNGTDTVVSVHFGCPGLASTQRACNDNGGGSCGSMDQGAQGDSFATFVAFGGSTYTIRVASTSPATAGPFQLHVQCDAFPVSFCDSSSVTCPCFNDGGAGRGCRNSTGTGALLSGSGSVSIGADNLTLTASSLPMNQFGILFSGTNDPQFAFGDGVRCVGQNILRSPIVNSGTSGSILIGNALGAAGLSGGASEVGSQRFLQAWYRDPSGPCGSAFNLSNALRLYVLP